MSTPRTLDLANLELPPGHVLRRSGRWGLGAGAVGLALTLALGWGAPKQALHSYLVAFLYFLTIALGALFFVLVQFITRAGWSVGVRRMAENLMASLPVFAVLFLPIALGLHEIFHWSHAEAVASDALLQGKRPYLQEPFFYARAALYFLTWSGLALWFRSLSVRQDATGDHQLTRRLQRASGPGLLAFGITVSFAAIDWVMSLDPHWFSTIFGVYFFAGCVVSAFAALAVLAVVMSHRGPLHGLVTVEHFHDLGKLLFAFVAFWAYIAFSQYFLIWYANIPEETLWYAHRMEGNWHGISIALALVHFVIPFFFLLPRSIKRRSSALLAGACWVLIAHYLDLYWLIMPTLQGHGALPHALDLTAFVGVGGVFVGTLGWLTARCALLPTRDPRLPEALSFENL